ncbi:MULTISPECIES: peptide chain release factor N(5)-glutamine methyltransferase [unclassified Apibacter]|uniref:peptide chain release factor N(5)-glutamine methyltransferase n=1 Tax=unclassified Apibacter TaxID=2630820 RepID=UPI00135DF64B|nr:MULTISPECIES: peptide chain release factor N(5)-glutamine methyltransferase [unclassified Apibacter]MXP04982.1 peptide chain release factor N(5)-glutamine methyltransferase [Apibacter sp. B3546]MXP11381.1 peptide chain release factor N(5)-glutamine methyltransferase [Apibacter sp. B3239]
MKSLAEIRNEFIKNLSSQYTLKEIDIIFYALAETYLHKDKITLKLGLDEMQEDSQIKSTLFQTALFHLISGMPYQYVVGYTEFYGCKISVNSHVLIPRPETEELVSWICNDFENKNEELNIIDLCSGSGCIAIALAKNLKAKVSALEIDEKAINLAKKNAESNQVQVDFIQADLLNTGHLIKNTEKYDIIVSNPPYIREYEKEGMESRVVNHEPSKALFVPNDDPLVFYRSIIDFSLKNMKPQGRVYVEINQDLGEKTRQLFLEYFNYVELKQDISGNFRMIKAKEIVF